jgi:hypothetical protein
MRRIGKLIADEGQLLSEKSLRIIKLNKILEAMITVIETFVCNSLRSVERGKTVLNAHVKLISSK